MTQGGPSDATSLVLFYIYQQAHQNYDVGLASAATVVSVAFLFALSLCRCARWSAAHIMKAEGRATNPPPLEGGGRAEGSLVARFDPSPNPLPQGEGEIRARPSSFCSCGRPAVGDHRSPGWRWPACARTPPARCDIASLVPSGPFSLANFTDAWSDGTFPALVPQHRAAVRRHPAVQCVTVSLAGYAFARLRFRCRDTLFYAVPAAAHAGAADPDRAQHDDTDRAAPVRHAARRDAAPYFASAFGVFLMRQTFRTIPREYEEAAMVDGASRADDHLPRAAAAGAARAWSRSPSSRSPRTGTSSCGR